MSSTQHQLIEQCAIRLRGIVEALDNIHDSTQHRSPHRWSTDLDDVHSSAESLLALIKDQAPTQAAQGLAGAALAQAEQATADDYEEVLADHRRLVRELDVLLNGEEGAAKQASLCDLVGQVAAIVRERCAPLLSPAQAGQVPQAWLDVQAERRRQITAEGWTPEHDDEHSHGQMARASACYALAGSSAPNDGTAALLVSLAWPWDEQWWKPSTARRDMVKACALGLAEIERLDRTAATQGGPRDA
ncbi:hypothetical protein [Pseudomonas aeruginosa]|uniref:hypothetical protein n=1 Tax=Pseudomonas aeruginosa TaxID=287 RepID=UPI0005BADDCA|nr:hypothetical protein [Pseudomonas aeruginosa]